MIHEPIGVIFDFDGVIVDSAERHFRCWKKVADSLHKALPRDIFLKGFGVKNEYFIKEMLSWTDDDDEVTAIIKQKEQFFQTLIVTEDLPLIPGILEFVELLQDNAIPYVIGSSSIRKNIDMIFTRLHIQHTFPLLVSGESVQRGKPDPEVFIRCKDLIHIPAERCIVFEDAFYGIEAARNAHMKTVGLTTTFSEKEFLQQPQYPDKLISNFYGVNVNFLYSLYK